MCEASSVGQETGKSPVGRVKSRWKLSLLTYAAGISLRWSADAAERHGSKTLAPALASARRLGVVEHFEALLADSGYDSRLRQGVRRVFRGRWL